MNHRDALHALATIAVSRDHITTLELATALNRRPQTIRKNLCVMGHAWGLRPFRLSRSGPLQWPVHEVIRLLSGRGTVDST
jgi:hypothetical protein